MAPESREPIRILVAEDEGIAALDTCDQLRALGHRVTAAVFSARDAVLQVETERPDLVLMDVRLKGPIDGIAAATEIRARFDVPTIFVTAYADDATVQRAKLAEPFGYVLKPFDERELRIAIEVALYKHGMERQRADLLAMLSHDIRNPLGVILAYTDILRDQLASGDRAQAEDLIQQLGRTAHSVHTLVSNYLEASRIESGHLSLRRAPLQLNDVVRTVGLQHEAEARRRRVGLEVALQEELPLVDADQIACERVLTNLLYNALKFTPRDGRVTITTATRGHDVVVAVADTGEGIPVERTPHLFERYQEPASRQKGGGTGLGLFIVKTLVDAHGGRIEVASTPGRGTCFSVVLSAVSAIAPAA